MQYIIITPNGDRSRPVEDYFKAFQYALYNKCILLKRNDTGETVEINNFTNL